MKKAFSALLIVCIILMSFTSFADFSLEVPNEYTNLYNVSESDEDSIAFIDTSSLLSPADMSFTFEGESEYYYSNLYNDIIVVDYGKSSEYAVWRLWIDYYGKEPVYADTVTFHFMGKDYTFSDVYDSDNTGKTDEGEYTQSIMIKFGESNTAFNEGINEYYDTLGEDVLKTLYANEGLEPVSMTLSGYGEITVDISTWFYLDNYLMGYAFAIGGGELSDASNCTALSVTDTPVAGKTVKHH